MVKLLCMMLHPYKKQSITMKKILILLVAAVMFACNNNQEDFTIKIDVEELAGTQLALMQNVAGEIVTVDSVLLDESGTGTLSGVIENPEIMYLGERGERSPIQIYMDNYDYTVSGTLDDLKIEADGGPQVEYNSYLEGTKEFQGKQQGVIEEFYAAQAEGADEATMNAILERYYAINNEKSAYDSTFMAINPASPVSLFLLRSIYYSMDADELETALSAFDESLQDTQYYTHMTDHLERMRSVAIGQKYTDLELPDENGEMMKLSDVAEKGVLLIDFWAAWCGPCRNANPGIVEIYNEFGDKGFDIIGVSLDRSKEEWLQAIEDDKLTWHHMSDLKFWQSEAAKTYAVAAIPHTVLLDADGTIIAKNLSKDELKKKLTELLGS
jgi:peroxiredoxin